MASRKVSSGGPCRCLRCRQGRWGSRRIPRSHQHTVVRFQSEKHYQQEMDAVRRELAVLIADSTMSDLRKKHSQLWYLTEVHNYEAIQMLENVKRREKAMNDLQESIQSNEDNIQLEISRHPELQESIVRINHNISQLKASFHDDKKAALQRSQESVQEKYQCQIDKIQSSHNSTKLAFDNIHKLQAEVTNSRSERERQLETKHMGRVEMMLEKATEDMLQEKREWICLKRSETEKEQAEYKNSLRQKIVSDLKELSEREMEMMISEARLASLEEHKLTRQAKIAQILAAAKKQWQEEHVRDIKQLTRKRQFDESESFCKDD